jgi:peptide/nickel transport system substrate-binding protein
MAYAIDFDDAISTIFKGEATRIFTLVPDAFPESVPAFKRYSYNPTKAKELLAQAGYPNGFDTQLWYSPTHYGATEADIAVKIQSYLKAVGINAELRYAEWATYVASWKNGMFPMFFYGWTPNLYEADDYVRPFMESNSYLAGPTGYASATADELLSQVAVETDPAKVRDLYAKLQELMAEDLPELVGWMPKDYAFVRDNVKGFQWCPVFSATDLTRVTVD